MRRLGKSYAHPFVVLIALANGLDHPRVGVAAGRSIGNAVERNRAKRRLREAIRPLLAGIANGQDILLLARTGLKAAKGDVLQSALKEMIKKANLVKPPS